MDPDAGALTIHASIEAQTRETPERIAVVSPTRMLSYRSLNEEANRLAHALVGLADPVEMPVVVACSLGAAQLVALLAVLKAGRFLVSLNPSDPLARNQSLVRSLGARTIITESATSALGRTLVGGDGHVLDAEAFAGPQPAANLDLPVRADVLARIVMTSGSTGEPKGIMQTHRTALFGAIARNNAVHLSSDDGFLVGTSNFTDLWRPLLVGGTLYLFDLKGGDLNCLRGWIGDSRISAFRCTPSVFRQLVATLALRDANRTDSNARSFPSLRVIELMGEPVSWDHVRLYRWHFSRDCILINFLGSKEVLDYRAYYVDHWTPEVDDAVPAGYPLGDAVVTLVDEQGGPVETGTVGEIAVRTASMSPGYWRRPDLTSERFRCDILDGGGRIYLTGDRGRLMPDNCLAYVGRNDFTVKIRGHRVDMAYLEEVLRELDSISEVAVVAKTAEHDDVRLVAFVVTRAPERTTERDIRRELAERVPDSMIPSEIIFLDRVPATSMGKVDREGLRSLGVASRRQTEPDRFAQSLIEDQIAAIWAEVLNLRHVGRQDNFFQIGGNSLLVMAASAAIQKRLEVELPLSAMFERPTVMELADYLRHGSLSSGKPDVASRPRVGVVAIGGNRETT